jgi:hypothetical protein
MVCERASFARPFLFERYFFEWSSNGAIAKRRHAGKAAYQKQARQNLNRASDWTLTSLPHHAAISWWKSIQGS